MKKAVLKAGTMLSTILFWVGILIYLVWAWGIGKRGSEKIEVTELRINVEDSSEINIVTPKVVLDKLYKLGLDPVGGKVCDVANVAIHDALGELIFIKDAEVSTAYNGVTSINITQREPLVRIISSGHDFYISKDGYILPGGYTTAHYTPVVTGNFSLPFEKGFTGDLKEFIEKNEKNRDKNWIFLSKLINFVDYIRCDDYWNSQIVQIIATNRADKNLTLGPDIELVPRVGSQLIVLGGVDNFEYKLDKLMAFYRYADSEDGWSAQRIIDISYANQIVCRK